MTLCFEKKTIGFCKKEHKICAKNNLVDVGRFCGFHTISHISWSSIHFEHINEPPGPTYWTYWTSRSFSTRWGELGKLWSQHMVEWLAPIIGRERERKIARKLSLQAFYQFSAALSLYAITHIIHRVCQRCLCWEMGQFNTERSFWAGGNLLGTLQHMIDALLSPIFSELIRTSQENDQNTFCAGFYA